VRKIAQGGRLQWPAARIPELPTAGSCGGERGGAVIRHGQKTAAGLVRQQRRSLGFALALENAGLPSVLTCTARTREQAKREADWARRAVKAALCASPVDSPNGDVTDRAGARPAWRSAAPMGFDGGPGGSLRCPLAWVGRIDAAFTRPARMPPDSTPRSDCSWRSSKLTAWWEGHGATRPADRPQSNLAGPARALLARRAALS